MSEFFTWATLLTYAGAAAFVALVTQIFKGVGPISKIPTQIFSYIVALLTLLAATLFTSGLTLDAAALCVVNAFVVSLASNGAFEALTQKKE